MQYFFYGTLCDPDVRRLVLGYAPSPRQLRPAVLSGFRRKQARGRLYPLLVPSPAGQVDGELFTPARPADAARLAAYEGPEYVIRSLPVQPIGSAGSVRAQVFLPIRNLIAGRSDWDLENWRRTHKAAFLRSLQTQGPLPCANP